jgi:hypothetical protein
MIGEKVISTISSVKFHETSFANISLALAMPCHSTGKRGFIFAESGCSNEGSFVPGIVEPKIHFGLHE